MGRHHQTTMTEPRPGVPLPSDEQCDEWVDRHSTLHDDFRDAAAWGADEQLRLCVEWLCNNGWAKAADELDPAMRPKPPSLKQQALEAMEKVGGFNDDRAVILQALRSIPD
jgi:hypothetical protein